MRLSAPEAPQAVVMGAGSLDIYPPPITYSGTLPEDYVAGGKVGWREEDEKHLRTLLDAKTEVPQKVEQHAGGNGLNTAAYLAHIGLYEVRFAGVVGDKDDNASNMIRQTLDRFGIADATIAVPGYLPSVGLIVRFADDRMVRGRARHPLDDYWHNERIAATFADADIAIAASLKSTKLTQRWLAQTPETAFRSLNPGSSEFDTDPHGLSKALQEQPVDLLALNQDELRKLLDADGDQPVEKLALRTAKYHAKHVLCTLGKAGLLIAHNGQVSRAPSVRVENVVDTLGAGDRAHGIAVDLLARGEDPQRAAETAAAGSAKVIQVVGAHGDLY